MKHLGLILGMIMAAFCVYNLAMGNYAGALLNFAFAAINLYFYWSSMRPPHRW
jgi:uncharacterized membrane protein